MTRTGVRAMLHQHEAVERELGLRVTLAVCMPANDRMDDLVEKATELGAAGFVPLMSERSVLRLHGERATKRQAHWQAVAVAASEQSGRNRVPVVHPVQSLESLPGGAGPAALETANTRWQLSLSTQASGISATCQAMQSEISTQAGAHIVVLSGPEGGLSPIEQTHAEKAGFAPVSLGPRTLRADTAPLAALATLGAWWPTSPSPAPAAR